MRWRENDVRAADRTLRAVQTVELDIARELGVLAHASGVDGDVALSVAFESHVHAVARGAGHFGNDDAFGSREAVDERALARVAAPDNRDLQ
jgi:hypothetical protein